MVRNHAQQTSELQYLADDRALKMLNDRILLLVTPSGKECKMNINDVKLCTTLELVENI